MKRVKQSRGEAVETILREAALRLSPSLVTLSPFHHPSTGGRYRMPLYDYRCNDCGDFDAWRKLAELKLPMLCPSCESPAKRLFSPPNINLNSGRFPASRQSSKEPKVVTRKNRETSQAKNQSSNCSRPWMIGHAPERL